MPKVSSTDVDVVVIGAEPKGLTAVALFGRLGHRVVELEKHQAPYGLLRAGHVDHEAVRILQALGAHHELLDDATPYGDYSRYDSDGEQLFALDFGKRSGSHWYTDYTIYQPTLEAGLLLAVSQLGERVEVRYGIEVLSVINSEGHVEVLTNSRQDPAATMSVKARWAIAADGARSRIRDSFVIIRSDLGLQERWLIVDAEVKRQWPGHGRGARYGDWRHPAFETPLGKRHHWDWCLLAGESVTEFEQETTCAAWTASQAECVLTRRGGMGGHGRTRAPRRHRTGRDPRRELHHAGLGARWPPTFIGPQRAHLLVCLSRQDRSTRRGRLVLGHPGTRGDLTLRRTT